MAVKSLRRSCREAPNLATGGKCGPRNTGVNCVLMTLWEICHVREPRFVEPDLNAPRVSGLSRELNPGLKRGI